MAVGYRRREQIFFQNRALEFKIVYSIFLRSGGRRSLKNDLWEHKTLKNKSKGKDRKEGEDKRGCVVEDAKGGVACRFLRPCDLQYRLNLEVDR